MTRFLAKPRRSSRWAARILSNAAVGCPAFDVRKELAFKASQVGLDQRRVTDITEHPTREGKVCSAVVLDAFSRCVVGWSTDGQPAASLVTNALGIAVEQRRAEDGRAVIHSDQGTQFTSWAFTQGAVDSGLLPSMGSVEDRYDNAMIESFWSPTQVELLNRRRGHSSPGMLSPVEYELRNAS